MEVKTGAVKAIANLKRKADAADQMFSKLVSLMNNELKIEQQERNTKTETLPSWL